VIGKSNADTHPDPSMTISETDRDL